MWIDGHPVLNIIDRGTRHSAAKFLLTESAGHISDVILNFWITVFTGFLYVTFQDLGPILGSEVYTFFHMHYIL